MSAPHCAKLRWRRAPGCTWSRTIESGASSSALPPRRTPSNRPIRHTGPSSRSGPRWPRTATTAFPPARATTGPPPTNAGSSGTTPAAGALHRDHRDPFRAGTRDRGLDVLRVRAVRRCGRRTGHAARAAHGHRGGTDRLVLVAADRGRSGARGAAALDRWTAGDPRSSCASAAAGRCPPPRGVRSTISCCHRCPRPSEHARLRRKPSGSEVAR